MEDIDILNSNQHIGIKEFAELKIENLVLDVRPELEFRMCNLPGSINFPFSKIERHEEIERLEKILEKNLQQQRTGK